MKNKKERIIEIIREIIRICIVNAIIFFVAVCLSRLIEMLPKWTDGLIILAGVGIVLALIKKIK